MIESNIYLEMILHTNLDLTPYVGHTSNRLYSLFFKFQGEQLQNGHVLQL